MKVRDALALGVECLQARPGLADPRREAVWLLARAWGLTEVKVRTEPELSVPAAVQHRYADWLHRRAQGMPAHHLTGTCPFWNRAFRVSPAVLIPRPETELLIEAVLEEEAPVQARVLDVGTGSGCIAVTLAAERPQWRVTATDRSMAALAVARANARDHQAEVNLAAGDLATALGCAFDVVTANLPYIPTATLPELHPEVQYDPVAALDGGPDGLVLLRRLMADLPRLLRPSGRAVLEVGENQAGAVCSLAQAAGLDQSRRITDLGGCERVLVLAG